MSYVYLVILAFVSLGNLAKVLEEDLTITGLVIGIMTTIPVIGICWLWWRYFKKRQHWFQPLKV